MTPLTKVKQEIPPGHEIPDAILERMGFLLNRSALKFKEATDNALQSFGLTGKHVGIMVLIREKESLPQQEIGKCMHVDRTTMVSFIDDLEKLGLVERKEHPDDRRAHAIYLTAKGREVLARALKLGMAAERKFLSVLAEKDRKELSRILKHLVLSHHLQEAHQTR